MKKRTYLKEIQKRLPDDLIIKDETSFEYTEDEFISILCWIKYFNNHYKIFGKNEIPEVVFPIISKRLRLDFGLYTSESHISDEYGKHIIYLSENGKIF